MSGLPRQPNIGEYFITCVKSKLLQNEMKGSECDRQFMQGMEIYVNYANLCRVLTTLFIQTKRKKTLDLLQPSRYYDQDFVA